MTPLTTRQRDLLHKLLQASAPVGTADLAAAMHLTARQVNYDLKGVKRWLAHRNVTLKVTPGVGVELDCSIPGQKAVAADLVAETDLQLVLTVAQRRQLITLSLLVASEPMILYQLQNLLQVSRTTVLKDLDTVATWLAAQDVSLERRPNYGLWIESDEQRRRQTIAKLLWGIPALGAPLIRIEHRDGLVFSLGADAHLLPIVAHAAAILERWDIHRTFALVTHAEAQLGGRFTDDAVLHLALMLALQTQRVHDGQTIIMAPERLAWLQSLPVWMVAEQVAKRLSWRVSMIWPDSEVANIAMHILATPRNERWPGDLETDAVFADLIDQLVERVAAAYNLPSLSQDKILHDGLVTHIIPATFRQRFDLWMPAPSSTTALSSKYQFEHDLAHELAAMTDTHAHISLPDDEINNIALLLRAAYIRERPNHLQRVVVVCPSGMATAQLLVARLKARFPRLGAVEVLSLRELDGAKVDAAQLIITTIPLAGSITHDKEVIQVHPLLLPEDIETITQWLAR